MSAGEVCFDCILFYIAISKGKNLLQESCDQMLVSVTGELLREANYAPLMIWHHKTNIKIKLKCKSLRLCCN